MTLQRFIRPRASHRFTEVVLIILIAAVSVWGSAAAYEHQHRKEPLCESHVTHGAVVHCVVKGAK